MSPREWRMPCLPYPKRDEQTNHAVARKHPEHSLLAPAVSSLGYDPQQQLRLGTGDTGIGAQPSHEGIEPLGSLALNQN